MISYRRGRRKTTIDIIKLVLLFLFLVPDTAFAYLDPGSGNILVYITVSLFGAFLYSLKGFFWALVGNNLGKKVVDMDYNNIAVFSEGKNYWNTFRPILNALIAMKQPFSYFSMDINDPGLTIEDDLMQSRYIGEGSVAFAKMGIVRSKIMISTTPNIGTPGFPMPRPPYVERLIHVCHAVDDIGLYAKGSLDHYDAVFLVGDFMASGIRYIEHRRGLKEKTLIPAGLPYLDDLASRVKHPLPVTDGKTILIAPTWGPKSCLHKYGSDFIKNLAVAGFNIILRPHPHSWKVEAPILQQMRYELAKVNNVEWDQEPDGAMAMEKADLLISEASGIRMDFALLYERPVITLKIELANPEKYEISDMDEAWMGKAELIIGSVVTSDKIDNIAQIVADTLSQHKKRSLSAFREANVCNFGSSGEFIAEYLINLVNGKRETV
ncbi:CDP-glycerol glycerophosphotransferase [Synergistales bacterium]|nr:CDP-glycerol glycerophosphotransferase [Synergistales bacterium]